MAAPPGGKPPIRLSPLAKGHSYSFTFQTPAGVELLDDDVQIIERENIAPAYSRPAIGSAHPDSARFPLHVLSVVIPTAETQTDKLYYAKPRSLVSYESTPEGQTATKTSALIDASDTPPPPTATRNVKAENLSNGKLRLTVSDVPSVFPQTQYSTEVLDITPPEFKAGVPTSTVAVTSEGSASTPTLAPGDLRKSDEQVTAFKHRLTTSGRGGISLPVSVTNREANEAKQDVQVVRTLQLATDPQVENTATQSVKITNLGLGTVLQEVSAVPAVFEAARYGIEIPDIVPTEFRPAVPTSMSAITLTGTASAPSLGTGDLSKTDDAVSLFTHRVTTTGRGGISLPVSLAETDTNQEKQVVTKTRTLQLATDSQPPPTATQTVLAKNLGNGQVILEIAAVPEVFQATASSIEIPDLVPSEMRAAAPTTSVEQTLLGTAANPPTLGTGDLSKSEAQTTEFTKRVTTRGRGGISLPVSLAETDTNQEKQVVTKTRTLQLATDSQPPPTATQTVLAKNLGNGQVILEVAAVPEIFSAKSRQIGTELTIPLRFRSNSGVNTTGDTVAGTVPDNVSLGTGEVQRAEAQQTEFTKRVTATVFNADLATELGGQQTGEFGVETIAESLVADGTNADSGFGVASSNTDPISDTLSIRKTVRYPNPGVAEVIITAGGSGYTDGSYSLGFSGGTGSGAAGTYTVSGNVVVRAAITAPGIYTALPTATFPSGGGSSAAGTAIEGHPAKISRLFDEEMLVTYPRSEQIIQTITDAQAALLQAQAVSGEMKQLIGIDVWHSRLIKETKVPLAVDEASAIISSHTRPFAFPGYLSIEPAFYNGSTGLFFMIPTNVRKTRADLVKARILTYWVTSATSPEIAVDEIITDSPFIETMPTHGGSTEPDYIKYEGVLHDQILSDYLYSGTHVFYLYPATTPSYSEYIYAWIGTERNTTVSVTPTKQKNLWKVEIEKIKMR